MKPTPKRLSPGLIDDGAVHVHLASLTDVTQVALLLRRASKCAMLLAVMRWQRSTRGIRDIFKPGDLLG